MNPIITQTLAQILQLPFYDGGPTDGEVCFATSAELRDEFKIQFTAMDVMHYVYGIISEMHKTDVANLKSKTPLQIPYPNTAASFWKYCAIGKDYLSSTPAVALEIMEVSKIKWYTKGIKP